MTAPTPEMPVDRANQPIAPELVPLTEDFENGYHFPPKYPFKTQCAHAWKTSVAFVTTWKGFLITIYCLNVVAWGGMLFLLLCNASPAMCDPNCEDKDTSPRQIWLEIDSQILNALFCLLAWGLAPWRFRDLYYLLKYRCSGDFDGLRHLAGIHSDWFRLPESQNLSTDVGVGNIPEGTPAAAVPIPDSKMAPAPLTGVRAPATPLWKLDTVVWLFISNTFLQVGLASIMWGINKYNRPSAATAMLVVLGCLTGMVAGQIMGSEGSSVKAVEGVPLTDEDREKLRSDREAGILHYNNKKDKAPKEKKKPCDSSEKIPPV
ncbi:hypothetical protein RB599_011026 [Gaeumannomyces hyphopodioides]